MQHRSDIRLPYSRPRPNDGRIGRPGQSAGGVPPVGRVRGGRPEVDRVAPPEYLNDGQIRRRRGPWWHTSNYIPIAAPLRPTESGPIRAELHLHRFNYRREQGSSGRSQEGLHTMMPQPVPTRTSGPRARLTGLQFGTWYRGQSATGR